MLFSGCQWCGLPKPVGVGDRKIAMGRWVQGRNYALVNDIAVNLRAGEDSWFGGSRGSIASAASGHGRRHRRGTRNQRGAKHGDQDSLSDTALETCGPHLQWSRCVCDRERDGHDDDVPESHRLALVPLQVVPPTALY